MLDITLNPLGINHAVILPAGWTKLNSIIINGDGQEFTYFKSGVFPSAEVKTTVEFRFFGEYGRVGCYIINSRVASPTAYSMPLSVRASYGITLVYSASEQKPWFRQSWDQSPIIGQKTVFKSHAKLPQYVYSEWSPQLAEVFNDYTDMGGCEFDPRLAEREYLIGAGYAPNELPASDYSAKLEFYRIKLESGGKLIDCVPALSPSGTAELFDLVAGEPITRVGNGVIYTTI